jgi:hypothetical protein
MKLAPTRPFPAVWGQRIAYCNVSALLVVATDIRGTLLASVPRVWSSPMCVWMRWAVTRAPKKACHEMSEKGPFWGQLKVKAPKRKVSGRPSDGCHRVQSTEGLGTRRVPPADIWHIWHMTPSPCHWWPAWRHSSRGSPRCRATPNRRSHSRGWSWAGGRIIR